MNHVGLLTVRNEVDVIDEFLDDAERYFEEIVVMDDSNDGTRERIAQRPFVKLLLRFEDVYDPNGPRTDGQKKVLFEYIVREYGFGTWVTVLNADAFFGDDPNRAVEIADKQCACHVHWVTYNFFPHQEDEPAYLEDKDAWLVLPVQKRLMWVQNHEWFEAMQFRVENGMYYDVKQHHRIIPEGIGVRAAPIKPVLLHYPLRSPDQIRKRMADRLLTGFRKDGYFKPWIESGGFVRPGHKCWGQMKRWSEMGVKLFSVK